MLPLKYLCDQFEKVFFSFSCARLCYGMYFNFDEMLVKTQDGIV